MSKQLLEHPPAKRPLPPTCRLPIGLIYAVIIDRKRRHGVQKAEKYHLPPLGKQKGRCLEGDTPSEAIARKQDVSLRKTPGNFRRSKLTGCRHVGQQGSRAVEVRQFQRLQPAV